MQCHLEPTSGRLPALVRRFNRGIFSYIPGQPLEDYVLYFDHVKLALPRASIDSVHEKIQRCASDEQQARENGGGDEQRSFPTLKELALKTAKLGHEHPLRPLDAR